MNSAPARTTETLTSTPSIKTHGHLALLEWDEKLPALQAQTAEVTSTRLLGDPLRKSALDRCYDGGTLVLLAVTVAALAESLCRF